MSPAREARRAATEYDLKFKALRAFPGCFENARIISSAGRLARVRHRSSA
jgi:hypothetical protein